MSSNSEGPFPALSMVYDMFAIPVNFFLGFIVGVVAPVVAIAATVAGVRLLTGRVPFLGQTTEDEEGERHLSLELVPPDQVSDLFAEQKDRIGSDLGQMQAEIKAIIEEARAEAEAAAQQGEPAEA